MMPIMFLRSKRSDRLPTTSSVMIVSTPPMVRENAAVAKSKPLPVIDTT